jgi:hypothetical protein
VQQIRETLKRARSALPERALAYDTEAADHPDSIYTLETYRLALDGSEFELALYALAGVARAADAGPACWISLAEAARLIGPESEQRLHVIRGNE